MKLNVLEKIILNNKNMQVLTKEFINVRKTPFFKFRCPNNHEFEQSYKFVAYKGYKVECSICNNQRYDFNKLAEVIENKNPSLTLLKVESVKLIIRCEKHGEFIANKYATINNSRFICKECGKENNLDKIRIKEVEKLKLYLPKHISFEEDDYINQSKKLKLTCEYHGPFYKSVNKIYTKCSMCPKCNNTKSNGEVYFEKLLIENNISYTPQKEFSDCKSIKKLKFDFYLDRLNKIVEIDGKQHFDKNSRFYSEDLVYRDNIKDKYCEENNIDLIRIKYHKFDKEFKDNCETVVNNLKSSTTIP